MGAGKDIRAQEDGAGGTPVAVACSDFTYSASSGSGVLLNRVNLLVEPGEMLAVIGAGGAGKSVLLSNLALRPVHGKVVRSGEILYNGCAATPEAVQSLCSYIGSEAKMLPYLTVMETLTTAASLKLPGVPWEERENRVNRLLRQLGLWQCRDTFIGGEWRKGLSTGEKKRVGIAIELLGDPSVLVLDNPTSGLDSSLAYELISFLRQLAALGRTVICSVNQPSSQLWSQLDLVLLLARGSVAYYGKANEAKAYFARNGLECPGHYSPADFFLGLSYTESGRDVLGRNSCCRKRDEEDGGGSSLRRKPEGTGDLPALFEASEECRSLKTRIAQNKTKPKGLTTRGKRQSSTLWEGCTVWCNQVKALSQRSFRNSIRNPIVCCVMLLVQALQGVILGGIFWQLTAHVQRQSLLDIAPVLNSPWSQLFVHGVTTSSTGGIPGTHPLLDSLTNGVDGNQSQPIAAALSDAASLEWLEQVLSCAVPKLRRKSYPTFGLSYKPPVDGDGFFSPQAVVPKLVSLTQLLDWSYLKHRWWGPAKTTSLPDLYWLNLTETIKDDLLNPFMACAGYPIFKSVFKKRARSRRLLAFDDNTQITNVIDELTHNRGNSRGGRASELLAASKQIVARVEECRNAACVWVGSRYRKIVHLKTEVQNVLLAVVNVLGALFFAVANLGFASYDALLTFPQERVIFNREAASGLYRVSSYFVAKNLADLPFQILPSFALVTIYYIFTGIGNGGLGQYLVYISVCSCVTFAAYGFGYLVSAASPRMEVAVLVAPAVLVLWLTLAGFFLRDEQIPSWISWFSHFSFYKWGLSSLVVNQFPPKETFGLLPNRIPLVMAGIVDTRIWFTTFCLLLLGLLYRVLGFFALKYTNRRAGLLRF